MEMLYEVNDCKLGQPIRTGDYDYAIRVFHNRTKVTKYDEQYPVFFNLIVVEDGEVLDRWIKHMVLIPSKRQVLYSCDDDSKQCQLLSHEIYSGKDTAYNGDE